MSLVAEQDLLKKELGLRDLVLTQIVFVVGTSWVGTAAKLGSSQTVYWLLAIVLFYLPVAAVVIYLNKLMVSRYARAFLTMRVWRVCGIVPKFAC